MASHESDDRYYSRIELLLCVLVVPIGVGLEFAPPFQRPIPYQELESVGEVVLSFVYNNSESGETVSPALAFGVAVVVPALLQFVLAWRMSKKEGAAHPDLVHKTLCVYPLAVGLTQTLTNLAKLYAGYLRPIFYDICEPDEDFLECTGENDQGRKSFPSGHASLSFCGLLLFCLFLEHAFGMTAHKKRVAASDAEAPPAVKLVRVWSVLCYAPILVAFFIAVSRVHDNHHHPADVVGGALLGATVANLIFGIWFR